MADGEIIQPARRRGRPPKAKPAVEPIAAAAVAPVAKAVPKAVEAAKRATKAPRKIAKVATKTVAAEADIVTRLTESTAALAAANIDQAADAAEAMQSAVSQATTDAVVEAQAVVVEAQPPISAPIDEPIVETPAALEAADYLKGLFPMATAPANAQALFSEINERAKGFYEKSVKANEDLVDFTKGNVEALVTSARVAAKGAEALTQEAAEYGKKSFETATTAFKSFATVKSPTELFQLQSDFAKSSFDGAVSEASKFSEGLLKLLGDTFQPLSSRYAVASEKFKATAL